MNFFPPFLDSLADLGDIRYQKSLSNSCEFRKHWRTESHTLHRGVHINKFISVLTHLFPIWMKISARKMHVALLNIANFVNIGAGNYPYVCTVKTSGILKVWGKNALVKSVVLHNEVHILQSCFVSLLFSTLRQCRSQTRALQDFLAADMREKERERERERERAYFRGRFITFSGLLSKNRYEQEPLLPCKGIFTQK